MSEAELSLYLSQYLAPLVDGQDVEFYVSPDGRLAAISIGAFTFNGKGWIDSEGLLMERGSNGLHPDPMAPYCEDIPPKTHVEAIELAWQRAKLEALGVEQ